MNPPKTTHKREETEQIGLDELVTVELFTIWLIIQLVHSKKLKTSHLWVLKHNSPHYLYYEYQVLDLYSARLPDDIDLTQTSFLTKWIKNMKSWKRNLRNYFF